MNNPLLTAAAWVIALALVVLAGISAYTTFIDTGVTETSWTEYQACARMHGWDSDPDLSVPAPVRELQAQYMHDNCDQYRPVPFDDRIPFPEF